MKTITALILVFGLFAVLPSPAATNDALIATHGVIIEFPADMTVTKQDWESGALERREGVTVLRLPEFTTRSGFDAYPRSTNSRAFPRKDSGATFRTQPEFRVTPILDADTVTFTGVTSVREPQGSPQTQTTEGELSEFWSRHYHFAGAQRVGEWEFYIPKGVRNNRRVCLAVRFTRWTEISQYIRRVFREKDGHLWFGTGDGACRYDGKSLAYFTTEDGLGGKQVNRILQDESGHLWFATSGGVSRYDGKGFTNYTFATFAQDFDVVNKGLGDNNVWSLLRDKAGNIWAGTPKGVHRYDGKSFVSFPIPSAGVKDSWSRFTPKLVWDIFEDKAGNLWFGTDGDGVRKYDGKTFTAYTDKDGLGTNNVVCITEDRAGNIWFGTWHGGVSRYDGKSFTTFTKKDGLPSNSVETILEDRRGHLWFGTGPPGCGACRYDGKSFTALTEKEGLAWNYCVQSIFEDKDGTLWFGCSGGLFRLEGKTFVNVTRDGPWR